jgi:hypothetical protein
MTPASQVDQVTLQDWCAKWQKILRLQDWDVKIDLAPASKMADKQGDVEWVKSQKTAKIRILEPSHYPADHTYPQDCEQTVVHELVHLHFAPVDRYNEGPQEMLLEQAVDLIAWALVKCDRNTAALPLAA